MIQNPVIHWNHKLSHTNVYILNTNTVTRTVLGTKGLYSHPSQDCNKNEDVHSLLKTMCEYTCTCMVLHLKILVSIIHSLIIRQINIVLCQKTYGEKHVVYKNNITQSKLHVYTSTLQSLQIFLSFVKCDIS